MLEVAKIRPCTPCGRETSQGLVATKTGAEWRCKTCGGVSASYSRGDMQRILRTASEALPAPPPASVPDGTVVFLEGPAGQEIELDAQFLRKHVEIMGELPKVGGSIYTSLPGIPGRLGAVPYGKVTRIECRST